MTKTAIKPFVLTKYHKDIARAAYDAYVQEGDENGIKLIKQVAHNWNKQEHASIETWRTIQAKGKAVIEQSKEVKTMSIRNQSNTQEIQVKSEPIGTDFILVSDAPEPEQASVPESREYVFQNGERMVTMKLTKEQYGYMIGMLNQRPIEQPVAQPAEQPAEKKAFKLPNGDEVLVNIHNGVERGINTGKAVTQLAFGIGLGAPRVMLEEGSVLVDRMINLVCTGLLSINEAAFGPKSK